MSIALYMDEQVPRQITTGLRLRGVDVLTVQEDERLGTPDPILLAHEKTLTSCAHSPDCRVIVALHG